MVSDKVAVLTAEFIYQSDLVGEVFVPLGFETDFASVPRLPFAYSFFGGLAKKASVIHDFLYRTGKVSRQTADAVFLEAMEASDLNWFRRRSMWAGVRLFGWTAYRKGKQ